MARIVLTIPDAVLPRVRAALCAQAGLPETNANAKEAVIAWIKETVRGMEYDAALSAERATVVPPDVDGSVFDPSCRAHPMFMAMITNTQVTIARNSTVASLDALARTLGETLTRSVRINTSPTPAITNTMRISPASTSYTLRPPGGDRDDDHR